MTVEGGGVGGNEKRILFDILEETFRYLPPPPPPPVLKCLKYFNSSFDILIAGLRAGCMVHSHTGLEGVDSTHLESKEPVSTV